MIAVPVMNQKVTIQQPAEVADDFNQLVPTWTDVATVWANVAPVSGREALVAAQLRAEVSHVVTIGFLGALVPDETMRLHFGTRFFNIGGVFDVDERNYIYKIYCTEVKGAAAQ